MSDLLLYLIKANVALALFCLGYYLLLRKLTFYGINRYYLVFALAFSALYPALPIDQWFAANQEAPPQLLLKLSDWQQLQLPEETNILSSVFSSAYWISIGLFGLLFLIKLMGIGRIHLRSVPARWDRFAYRKINEIISPFSFWTNIYFNPLLHTEDEYEKIFSHEQVHVRQLHSLDVLLVEITLIFFWYNPFCWLIRKAVQENIEFITDQRVLSLGIDKKSYQYSLLQISSLSPPSYLGNHFNFKNLKQRIIMMNKKQSSNMQLGKYVFIIPAIVVGSLILGVSKAYENDEIREKPQQNIHAKTNIPHPASLVEKVSDQTSSRSIDDTLLSEVPPLLMIDGSLLPLNSINKLDAEKVESIELKDAAALSIYGSRAENGIIQVTTKENSEASPLPAHEDTVKSKDPLFVVDGVKQYRADIRPDNIESVSVIKDKTAISLYGEEGKHGVIEVTTKQGMKDTKTNGTSERITPNPVEGTNSIKKIYKSTTLQPMDDHVLLFVDGAKVPYSTLNQLDPSDIQSLTVYKGENAIARHGEEGKDGVIEITTKSEN